MKAFPGVCRTSPAHFVRTGHRVAASSRGGEGLSGVDEREDGEDDDDGDGDGDSG